MIIKLTQAHIIGAFISYLIGVEPQAFGGIFAKRRTC